MKKALLIIISTIIAVFVFFIGTAMAQDAVVRSFEVASMDVSAQTHARTDRNGVKCALVKVRVIASGVEFRGNVMGEPEKHSGEYWVYMTAGTKMLQIGAETFLPFMYNFPQPLQSGVTYILTINAPQLATATSPKKEQNFLALKVTPPTAHVTVDGTEILLVNGGATKLLSAGAHTFRITAPGYAPVEETVTIANEKVTRSISLRSVKPHLSVTTATPGTEIFINDERKGTNRWSGELMADSYIVEGRLASHRSNSQIINLVDGQKHTVTIPALTPITGSLSIDYKPIDATVTIDGRSAGTTPLFLNNLLIGDHRVEISAPGYTSVSLSATVTESTPATLSGSLTAKPTTPKASAQKQQQTINSDAMPQVPMDNAVVKGQLPNGLTYYIRHNENPKGQADFFMAQTIGSILENDDQCGLTHFLEHMCFNGTRNFPGNKVISWLESKGVRFGHSLNAYTSLDETVYNISNVPLKSSGVVDSCLLVLHDWADGLLLDPAEIDKERGVIQEEWRRSNVGQMRLLEKLLPKIYPGSKYGERLPMGQMSVISSFKPQELRDYYEKWFRPDNQAIIVVGDIDPKDIQARIEKIFGPIKMPENPAPRVWEQVPDNPGTIYAIGSDKDLSASVAYMFFKLSDQLPRELKGTVVNFVNMYLTTMVQTIMNERFKEMAAKPDCPFAGARIDVGNFLLSSTKDALSLQVMGKGDDIRPAFEAAYSELKRAAKNGFTQDEYDRAKVQYIASFERMYEQRAGRDNTAYAREYAANFTQNEPIPGVEYELEMAKQASAMIPFQAFQKLLPELISSPDNRVFMALHRETATTHIVTEAEIAEIITRVEAE